MQTAFPNKHTPLTDPQGRATLPLHLKGVLGVLDNSNLYGVKYFTQLMNAVLPKSTQFVLIPGQCQSFSCRKVVQESYCLKGKTLTFSIMVDSR